MSPVETIIPVFLFLVVGATITVALLTRHRERVTMLDKGLSPQDIKSLYERSTSRPPNIYGSLKWGIVAIAIGLAILLGMWLQEQFHVDEGVFFGLIALFGGIGLVTFYLLASKRVSTGDH
jgi:Domain of unknown function (DUF6249)